MKNIQVVQLLPVQKPETKGNKTRSCWKHADKRRERREIRVQLKNQIGGVEND